jgi:hypothetical protein
MLNTATKAKNKFASVCNTANKKTVFVQKDSRIDAVNTSADQLKALKVIGNSWDLREQKSEFDEKFANWMKEMNQDFESVDH